MASASSSVLIFQGSENLILSVGSKCTIQTFFLFRYKCVSFFFTIQLSLEITSSLMIRSKVQMCESD